MQTTRYAELDAQGRAAEAQQRAEMYAEMAAERYAQAGIRGNLEQADRHCKLAEEWAARAIRERIDIMAGATS